MSSSSDDTTPLQAWGKQALTAGVEGAKDGLAYGAAQAFTTTVIEIIGKDYPTVPLAISTIPGLKKALEVVVPLTIGAVAAFGWLPAGERFQALSARAVRAAMAINFAPLIGRFTAPLLRVLRETEDFDRVGRD
jgi:hypothetical protein